ncbi:MAG: NAD(+)/NADH kinase [Desulfoprunum sp.]|nr:NAD(+)/NADH kinase [Desulfoprunum sp.]
MTSTFSPFRTVPRLEVQRAGIITKLDDTEAARYAARLQDWLAAKGIRTVLNAIDEDLDILIVLGGDGTLLHIAEKAALQAIPVVGINLGSLGFLTEFTEMETEKALERILSGPVTIENRLMLQARLISDGRTNGHRYALNDVVINKNAQDRLLNLATRADHDSITTYKADGLIFSSPTGSTAYNLSAGGPLVHPGLAAILVTPICPFMLGSRPIILPADRIITTGFAKGSNTEMAQIIIDGQPAWDLRKDDLLEVKAAAYPLQLITSSRRDYFSVLRTKLHWGYQENTSKD